MSDVTNPVIVAPADILFEAADPFTDLSIETPAVTDDTDPSSVVTNDAPTAFAVGTTIMTWTATDAQGNTSTAIQKVTVITPSSVTKDKFGISMIYKTATSEREWYSNWDNGKSRTILSGERDPYNSELIAR